MTRVAILGAGVAGLSAARALREAGAEVTLFDKGRGPGGRTSHRRAVPFAFDHGAQYLTARAPEFREQVERWASERVVAPWTGRVVALAHGAVESTSDDVVRWVGVPGMNALAKRLSLDLDVRSGVRVDSVAHDADGWSLRAGDTDLGTFEALVCTLPTGQAAELLECHSPLAARAAQVEMSPCRAVLLGLAERYDVPFDGAFVNAGELSWIARDSSKPGRPPHEAWVLHARPSWSAAHWDEPCDEAVRALSGELERATGVPLPLVLHADEHRWRYALADPPLEEGALVDHDRNLVLAGDWLAGGRVEGAWRSGRHAVTALSSLVPR